MTRCRFREIAFEKVSYRYATGFKRVKCDSGRGHDYCVQGIVAANIVCYLPSHLKFTPCI